MIRGRVVGLALFVAQLRQNENRLRHAAQKRAEQEAQRIVDEMKAAIPVDSGEARESIRWEPLPGMRGARVVAGGPETTKETYDYVRAIEFGRPAGADGEGGQAARPFFRSTADAARRAGAERITRGIAEDMED